MPLQGRDRDANDDAADTERAQLKSHHRHGPLVGASDGPIRLHMHGAKKQEEVRILLFVALGSMTALQLCAPLPSPARTHTHTPRWKDVKWIMRGREHSLC